MGKGCLVSLGVVGALLLAGLFIFFSFKGAQNQLVQKDEAVKNAWSNVDTDLQRRAAQRR